MVNEHPQTSGAIANIPKNHSLLSMASDRTDNSEDHLEDTFRILDMGHTGYVSSQQFIEIMASNGILMDDARLVDVKQALAERDALHKDINLNLEEFRLICGETMPFITRILEGKLMVPDFEDFVMKLELIYDRVKRNVKSGHNASYIPELAKIPHDSFAISVCTIDGQRWSIGDHTTPFSIQSCTKPITYLMALQEHGAEKVHYHVGTEPSGKSFNKLVLKDFGNSSPNEHGHTKERKIPHNPMINAGAIMSCSLLMPHATMADRFNKVIDTWNKLCGSRISFGNSVYLSEKSTADRNWCLGYMMQEYNAFPQWSKLSKTLDFYFQCCSMEANCGQMATLAATLANGGTSPLSGERIFDPQHVRNCLSIMLTSGMYDYSGEWAFRVGLPAKSGVGGCVYIVVPNKMGIAIWSPPLDENGNSVKGVTVAQELIKIFNFHHFDNLRGNLVGKSKKHDPTLRTRQELLRQVQAMLFAAAQGDVREMDRLCMQGANLFAEDYDARTGLHLACSEGHHRVVEFIISKTKHLSPEDQQRALSPKDRWARTPLDDAISSDNPECGELLKAAGALRGAGPTQKCASFRVLNLKKQRNIADGNSIASFDSNDAVSPTRRYMMSPQNARRTTYRGKPERGISSLFETQEFREVIEEGEEGDETEQTEETPTEDPTIYERPEYSIDESDNTPTKPPSATEAGGPGGGGSGEPQLHRGTSA